MRKLITGITGLLGYSLQKKLNYVEELFGIYYPERRLNVSSCANIRAADVTDLHAMENVFEWAKPDVVIHAAAVGSVDYAEQHKEFTRKVNVGGTEIVTRLCEKWRCRLIYISSNAVFDGTAPFYSEKDETNPINYYGQLKVDAEKVVMQSNVSWAIVRPILMYGWPYPEERGNLVTTWVRQLREEKRINVVDNVFSKPLCSIACAEAVNAVVEKNASGIFHIAGKDHVSLYDFALLTAEVFGLDSSLINPVPDTFFNELVPRPRDTSFDTSKMERELGIIPLSLRDGLRRMREAEKTESFLE
ncbi:MAG: SDR family oxidoreductase [Prolixibacteraceae bacterium]|jgi:dTDP-4-dehydrorhamnose reductase|nr:SDR family oxidoreductase [Prolixibacteraceae bacterium]